MTEEVATKQVKEEEDVADSDSDEDEAPKQWTAVKYVGVSHDRNARYRRSMEDAHVMIDSFGGDPSCAYFAVYDGHGGRAAVEIIEKTLHKNVEKEMQADSSDMAAMFKRAFLATDAVLAEQKVQFSGATAAVAIVRTVNGERWLHTANAGDARIVLGRNGTALRMTYDHKGSDAEEAKRITEAGGFIVLKRVNGVLAVTRSLGDHAMKDYVTAEPYCQDVKLSSTDMHLIVACDGLWDVADDQKAIDLVLAESDAQKMSDKLLVYALKNGSTDNISVMTVLL